MKKIKDCKDCIHCRGGKCFGNDEDRSCINPDDCKMYETKMYVGYERWQLTMTAQDGLNAVTLGSESPDFLFKTHHEINRNELTENACLSIAYLGEQIKKSNKRNGELMKEMVRLRRQLRGDA